jgi:hypothetical protein
MWPEDHGEVDQLEGLAAELTAAVRSAREAIAEASRPDSAFSARLRAEFMAKLPAGDDARAAVPGLADAAAAGAPDRARDAGLKVRDATSVRPTFRRFIPLRMPARRALAAGLAACVAVAALVVGSGYFFPARPGATTDAAVAATLIRGGTASALAAGTALGPGDEVRVAAGGRAILNLGSSVVRLDSGADVRLDSLNSTHEVVSQLAGRVYYRVSVPTGGDYQVITGSVTWQANGTAFDLDRRTTPGGGEQVVGLALQNGVALAGPQFQATVAQGDSATVTIKPDGSAGSSPSIAAITSQQLNATWLASNAHLDANLGLPLGLLAAVVAPTPTAAAQTPAAASPPPVEASPSPSAAPSPSEQPSATPQPVSAPPAATSPTPQPPSPAPSDFLGPLDVTYNPNGTYTFEWPRYTGTGSPYYELVYCAWGCEPSYSNSSLLPGVLPAAATSWTGYIPAGDYAFRVQAVDLSTAKPVIQSSSTIVRVIVNAGYSLPPTMDLGPLVVTDNQNGTYTFSWGPYIGGGPFNYYQLVFETTASGKTPDYLQGSPDWAVLGPGARSVTLTLGSGFFQAGDYMARVQAIGYANGVYVYAQTAVLHVPLPTPTASASPSAVASR